MVESYIQILMDIKGDYAESLDYLKQLEDFDQKFRLLKRYGEKFLEKQLEETVKVITAFIDDIILIKNGKKDHPNKEQIKKMEY